MPPFANASGVPEFAGGERLFNYTTTKGGAARHARQQDPTLLPELVPTATWMACRSVSSTDVCPACPNTAAGTCYAVAGHEDLGLKLATTAPLHHVQTLLLGTTKPMKSLLSCMTHEEQLCQEAARSG